MRSSEPDLYARDAALGRRVAVAGLLVCLGAGLARAGDLPRPEVEIPSPLHLDQAVSIFRTRGLDLLLADAATEGARADLRTAQALPNPLVAAAGGHTFAFDPHAPNCDGCSATSVSAGLSDQGLVADFLIGKRRLRIDVARQALEAAEGSRANSERVLLATVKEEYIHAVLARELLDFACETEDSLAETAGLVNDRLHAGHASAAEVARADTAKLAAEQAVDAAREQLAAAYSQLAFLLAVRGTVPAFEVEERLPPSQEPAALAGTTPEALIALAEEHRPDLAVATTEARLAESAMALARRERLPDVQLTGNYTQEGRGQNALQPPTLTFGVQLPLPVLDRNQGRIAKSESQLRVQRLRREKVEAQITDDVGTAWYAFQAAKTRVKRLLRERAQQARDLVHEQYKKGAVSLLERLDAERVHVAAVVESLKASADFCTACYQLEAAVGMELGCPEHGDVAGARPGEAARCSGTPSSRWPSWVQQPVAGDGAVAQPGAARHTR